MKLIIKNYKHKLMKKNKYKLEFSHVIVPRSVLTNVNIINFTKVEKKN